MAGRRTRHGRVYVVLDSRESVRAWLGWLGDIANNIKRDELHLLALIAAGHRPRATVEALGIPPKRAAFLFDKWIARRWYECGVSAFTGWLEPEGHRAARVLVGAGQLFDPATGVVRAHTFEVHDG